MPEPMFAEGPEPNMVQGRQAMPLAGSGMGFQRNRNPWIEDESQQKT
jgi:hypothetical protein